MKNLRIRMKLLVTFMLIILLFCATVITAITGLRQNAEKYSEFYNVGYQVTNKVMSMRRGLQIIVKDLTFITIEDEKEKGEVHLADMEKELAALEENATWLFENFTGEQALLDAFSEKVTKAEEMQQEVIDIAQADKGKAQKMLLNEYQPIVEEAVNSLIEISNAAEQGAKEDYESTTGMQETLIFIQLGMAAGALVITLLLSAYLTRAITKPLRDLEKAADKIVGGEFDIDVSYRSRDELGQLAEAFRNMVVILETVISDASRILSAMADGNFDVRTEDRKSVV